MAFSTLDMIRQWAQGQGYDYNAMTPEQQNRLAYAYQFANKGLDNTNYLGGTAYNRLAYEGGDSSMAPTSTPTDILSYFLDTYGNQNAENEILRSGDNQIYGYNQNALNENPFFAGYNQNTQYTINADPGTGTTAPSTTGGTTPPTSTTPTTDTAPTTSTAPGFVALDSTNAYPDYVMPEGFKQSAYTAPGEYVNALTADIAPTAMAEASLIDRIDPTQYEDITVDRTNAGAFNQLMNGDYNRLEQALYQSATAPLGQQETEWRRLADEGLAKRGIWSSGIAARNQNDITDKLADVYYKAAADAVAQRYGLQSGELQNKNAYQMQQAGLNQQTAIQQAQINAAKQNQLIQAEIDRLTNNAGNQQAINLANSAAENTRSMQAANNSNQMNLANSEGANAFNLANSNALNQFNLSNDTGANAFNLNTSNAANLYNQNVWRDTTQLATQQQQAANDFNLQTAQNNIQSQWLPWQYLAGLYGQTGGQNQNSNESGIRMGILS